MVEVLSNWDEYVTDPRHIAWRGGACAGFQPAPLARAVFDIGCCQLTDPHSNPLLAATYLFDADGAALYESKHRGVLTYSNTMSRPLTFLAPYIAERALNPLALRDQSLAAVSSDEQPETMPAAEAVVAEPVA